MWIFSDGENHFLVPGPRKRMKSTYFSSLEHKCVNVTFKAADQWRSVSRPLRHRWKGLHMPMQLTVIPILFIRRESTHGKLSRLPHKAKKKTNSEFKTGMHVLRQREIQVRRHLTWPRLWSMGLNKMVLWKQHAWRGKIIVGYSCHNLLMCLYISFHAFVQRLGEVCSYVAALLFKRSSCTHVIQNYLVPHFLVTEWNRLFVDKITVCWCGSILHRG